MLIFGQKLDIDERKRLTEPDFPKKIWIIQKFKEKCIFRHLRIFQKKSTLRNSSKTSEMVENNVRNHLRKFQGREKSGTIITKLSRGPKMGQNGPIE